MIRLPSFQKWPEPQLQSAGQRTSQIVPKQHIWFLVCSTILVATAALFLLNWIHCGDDTNFAMSMIQAPAGLLVFLESKMLREISTMQLLKLKM